MSANKKEVKEDEKKPETAAPEETESAQTEAAADDRKKKRALVVYLCIIFAAAFLLVAISLIVRIHTMKEDFNEANNQADMSYAALENQAMNMETKVENLEKTVQASELLTMAQNAYYKEDIQGFHSYMEELAKYADVLPQNMMNIYEDLKTIEGELK